MRGLFFQAASSLSMNLILSPAEIRVLGSLIEKELTTPEYYPLTLNALTNACNQKSNRDPVVEFRDTNVVRALDSLREKKLIGTVTGAGIRVPKYKHSFSETYNLSRQEISVLVLLMLRGPQTVGELRSRSSSMHPFESTVDVETVLTGLSTREQFPFVQKLPRQTGHKESRFTHLLSGEVHTPEADPPPPQEQAALKVFYENERIQRLEEELKNLNAKIESMQQQIIEFKKQFE